jgi:predicted ribosomally synthesized peptide with nif11-like leader
MSMSAVQDFFAKIAEDQSLQEELAKAMEAENDRQAVTDLAHSKGFDFTPEELAQEIQNRQAEAQRQIEAGELSEDELESVAGGEFMVVSMVKSMLGSVSPQVGSVSVQIKPWPPKTTKPKW